MKNRFGLPLLARELTELSARKRTYVLRVLYAAILFTIVIIMAPDAPTGVTNRSQLEALGSGARVFEDLFRLQMVGIFVFMPIISCSAIASEKERDTLQLLLVTHLGPVTILLEKLFSRVLFMLSMIIMSLPMMAYAFSLGGVTEGQIYGGLIVLTTTTVYVGSFTVLCSCLCSSTVSAFICTILLGIPFIAITAGCAFPAVSRGMEPSAFVGIVISQVFYSVLFFVIALAFLVERAMKPPKNIALEMFRSLDRFFTELNESMTGGVIVIQDTGRLPNDEPITWRESEKKALGKFRYLVRVFVVIELPTLLILLMHERFRFGQGVGLVLTLWAIAMTMLIAKVASIVSSERGRQTLDVLLTTPMSSNQIITQYLKGVRRLRLVLQIPIFTAIVFRIFWSFTATWELESGYILLYVPVTLCAIYVFFAFIEWFGIFVGLYIKSAIRALLLGTLGIWGLAVLPVIVTGGEILERESVLSALCPTSLIYRLETKSANLTLAFAHLAFWGLAVVLLRLFCLKHANELLGRGGQDDHNENKPLDFRADLGVIER